MRKENSISIDFYAFLDAEGILQEWCLKKVSWKFCEIWLRQEKLYIKKMDFV